MHVLEQIFLGNYLLMLPVLGWIAAQVIKTIVDLAINRKFQAERLVGSGGWPSSHSSTVCALFLGAAKKYGVSSPYFAITFVLAAIVMYDAMGVRREAGEQAKVLNRLLKDNDIEIDKKLKEMVGHTPFQVLSGALLGILLAIVLPVF